MAMVINGSGTISGLVPGGLPDGSLTYSELEASIPGMFGMRNRIINGACQVAQRGNVSISQNTWSYGGCDRIAGGPTGFSSFIGSLQQSPAAFVDGSRAQIMGPVTTTGSGSIQFQQRIEAVNCIGLNGKTVFGSFWVYQTTGTTITGTIILAKAVSEDNFGSQPQLASSAFSVPSDTWTQLWLTTTLGAADASNGLVLTYSAAVGAVSNRYFYITRLQLEQGSVITPFDIRPYGFELALCQRYYEAASFNWTMYQTTGSGFGSMQSFAVTKRTSPTMTVSTLAISNVTSAGVASQGSGFVNTGWASTTGVVVYAGTAFASVEL
jgi:hypothetical protein